MSKAPGWGDLGTLAFSYFAVGVTVSVALEDAGVPASNIVLAAAIMFSATAELAYLAAREAGGSQLAAIISGWMVSSRFGLLAMTLGPKIGGSWRYRAMSAVTAFDPNVALAVQQESKASARRAFWLTTAALMGGWALGTAVGIELGNVLGDSKKFGLDAVFPAALLAIIGNQLRRRDGLTAALVGALLCVALLPIAPGGLPILASGIGALVALAVKVDVEAPR